MAGIKHIRSSTVLEAIIALVLVLVVAGIATVVFGRAGVSGAAPAFIKAKQAIDSMAINPTLQNETITIDGLTITKESTPIENTTSWNLRFTITDSKGKPLETQDRIILIEQ